MIVPVGAIAGAIHMQNTIARHRREEEERREAEKKKKEQEQKNK